VVGAHAQGCVANDVMLVSTLKAFALCARSLHSNQMLDVFCMCLCVAAGAAAVVVVVVVVVQPVRVDRTNNTSAARHVSSTHRSDTSKALLRPPPPAQDHPLVGEM
jgi:hypothetical protein